jgi:hypothetical protein
MGFGPIHARPPPAGKQAPDKEQSQLAAQHHTVSESETLLFARRIRFDQRHNPSRGEVRIIAGAVITGR